MPKKKKDDEKEKDFASKMRGFFSNLPIGVPGSAGGEGKGTVESARQKMMDAYEKSKRKKGK